MKTILQSIDKAPKIHEVHASKGKFARAEPVAVLYEQNKIHHEPDLLDLETELMEYVPLTSKKSPDRLDALVWGLTFLFLKKPRERRMIVV